MSKPIQNRADFSTIRYANCWEDPTLLIEGLEPEGKRILSICSAGDNAIALAVAGAREVLAVDLNPSQVACFQIRRALLRELEWYRILEFVGERDQFPDDRRETYAKHLRRHLDEPSRIFWDAHPELVGNGILAAGRFERFLESFRLHWLPWIRRRSTIDALLRLEDQQQRREFWMRDWDDLPWRLLFAMAFSRPMLARGRDGEFLRYAQGPLASRLRERVERTCLDFPVGDNPWLRRILTGSFGQALPYWLRQDNIETVRQGIERVTTRIQPLEDAASEGGWECMNLSDIFEYMSQELFEETALRLRQGCVPGARLAHWNLFAPRRLCNATSGFLRLSEESERLFARDRACFYLDFNLEVAQ